MIIVAVCNAVAILSYLYSACTSQIKLKQMNVVAGYSIFFVFLAAIFLIYVKLSLTRASAYYVQAELPRLFPDQ